MAPAFVPRLPILCIAGILCATASFADVIYGETDPAGFPAAVASDVDTPAQVASAFTLAAGANTIADIHWWGVYDRGDGVAADDFTLSIFESNGSDGPQSDPGQSLQIMR